MCASNVFPKKRENLSRARASMYVYLFMHGYGHIYMYTEKIHHIQQYTRAFFRCGGGGSGMRLGVRRMRTGESEITTLPSIFNLLNGNGIMRWSELCEMILILIIDSDYLAVSFPYRKAYNMREHFPYHNMYGIGGMHGMH